MKKNKALIIALIIAAVIAGYVVIGGAVSTLGAKVYLADKYNWKITDIKTVEYHPDKIETDFGFMGLDATNTVSYINKKWVFEYGGRKFNAEHYNFHYADDYQLEDIFNWCTEYLQENYDSEIAGVEVYSDIIYHSSQYDFDYELPWNHKKVFTKDDAKELLEVQSKINKMPIFYLTKDLDYYGIKNNNVNFYTPNDNYTRFKNIKQKLLPFNSVIVLIEYAKFDYSKYSVVVNSSNQSIYTLSEKCFFQKVNGS